MRLWWRYFLLAREQGTGLRSAVRVATVLVRYRRVPVAELLCAVKQAMRPRLRVVRNA